MTEDAAQKKDTAGRRISANLRRNMQAVRLLAFSAGALLLAGLFGLITAGFAISLFVAIGFTTWLLLPDTQIAKQETTVIRAIWSEPIVRAIIDALPDPALVLDDKSVVRCVNSALNEEFGQITLGEPLSFRMRIPALLATVERAVAGDTTLEVEWSEKVSPHRWFKAYVAPLRPPETAAAAADPSRYFVVVIRDLSEQYRLDRMRADFVANASHELRTPLASLMGFVETLQGAARDDTLARDRFLEVMKDQAERMSRLINDLLSLSRIEMSAHNRPTTLVDLGDIVRHVLDAMSPLAEELKIEVFADLNVGPMPVRGDQDELVQVFENLIENAMKYGESGNRVEIHARREDAPDGDVFSVTVRDFGPGIAEEHLPRLTERFYRVDVASSREKKGTGLGLAIAKHILTRHRGRLAVESTLGQGAAFTVRIPVADDQ